MARPTAVGLKYFPFDVDLLDDEALDFLRDKYGMVVNDIYICLLCFLYKKYGYFIPYETEKEKEDCIWYIYKHIRGGKYPPDIKTVATVIDACVARELFSRELYPKIITSKRAQRTFYSCTAERKSVPICQDIWLLDIEDMGKLSKKHPYYLSLCPESKSDDKPNYSDDKPLNKTKLNITSNEVINNEVSKKEIKKDLQSYDEIFEELYVVKIVKDALIEFIRHLNVNGIKVINSRLEKMIISLDLKYRTDEQGKVKEIRQAIANGYKRLECEGEY